MEVPEGHSLLTLETADPDRDAHLLTLDDPGSHRLTVIRMKRTQPNGSPAFRRDSNVAKARRLFNFHRDVYY
jgi:hypothetical protein